MDVIEAMRTRKSIRGYKPDPVPKEILREILKAACHAPSGTNIQPWDFTVVTGEVLDKIRQANVERFDAAGEDAPRVTYPGKFRERQVALGAQLFQLMDIARQDEEKRAEWRRRGMRYFDAPAVIFISVDESLGDRRFDIGAVTQTIALAALKYGLGTCIQAQGVRYSDIVRKCTGIPESKRLVIDIAIGYPDWGFPANQVHSGREPIDNVTTWCGFDKT